MTWLVETSQSLQPYFPILIALLFLFCLVLLVLFLFQRRRVGELLGKLRSLARGMEGVNLEDALGRLSEEVKGATRKNTDLEGRLGNLDRRSQRFLQGMALERYDAFQDTSGELSFSWALLDALGNGAVLTGIYGRSEYRFYAKPLRNSGSYYPLSEEEKRAIAKAEEMISGKKAAAS
jgi:hypothetical protein